MSNQLSTGYLLNYFRGGSSVQKPILQVVDLKALTPERALMAISDGVYVTQALMNGPALELVNNKEVGIDCIVRLEAFAPAPARAQLPQGVLIVQNMTVLERGARRIENVITVASALAAQTTAPTTSMSDGPEGTGTSSGASMGTSGASAAATGVTRNPYGAAAGASRQAPATYVANGVQLTQIRAISPYQRSWTIKARVTSKSDIRTWANPKGEGKLFSVELLDQFGGQIRATMYQDACDKWFPVFKENEVYLISRCQVRTARRGFNRLINDYELTIESSSEVTPVPDDHSIGAVGLTARKTIGQIQEMKIASSDASNSTTTGMPGTTTSSADEPLVDVVGIVVEAKAIARIMSKKTNRELIKRDVSIVDRSLLRIDLTLWGDQAEKLTEEELAGAPSIIATACRVSDFGGGRSLSTSFSSQVLLNAQMPESVELKKWYDTEGHACAPFRSVSGTGSGSGTSSNLRSTERKSFADINDAHVLASNQAEWLTVRATITNFKNERETRPLWYEGCETCNRKVHSVGDGWSCDTCNKSFPTPNYVYNFSFQASDYQTSRWISVFGAKGDAILGVPASVMADYLNTNQYQEYDSRIAATQYKTYEMRVQARVATSRDNENTVRCTLWQATPLDFVEESRRMLKELNIA